MDFELEDYQQQFAKAVRKALSDCQGLARARAMAENDATASERVWSVAVDGGWPSLAASEQVGGGGGTALDLVLAAEAAGTFVAPIPLGWHAAVSRGLGGVAGCPEGLVEGTQSVDVALPMPGLPDIDLTVRQQRVTGRVLAVPGARTAEFLAVGVGTDLLLLAPNCRRTVQPTLDPSRPLVAYELERAPVIARVRGAVRDAVLLTAVCAAAECVGALDAFLSTGIEYAKIREQFGRPIGSFQAVQHLLVDCLLDLEPARNLTYFAGHAVDAGSMSEDERQAAIYGAYTLAVDALRDSGERLIQVFGGVGYTWECDAHLYWRRALGAASTTGPTSAYLRECARLQSQDC
ncbi:MAG: hypothetical protein GEV13_35485 [Rhodospirillales bacterium]|nr:hypothetical protein [Rhodospirillales bacterium]